MKAKKKPKPTEIEVTYEYIPPASEEERREQERRLGRVYDNFAYRDAQEREI